MSNERVVALPSSQVLRRLLQSSLPLWKKLDDYQRSAVEQALTIKTLAVFFEQGAGKTWVTGGVVEQLWNDDFSALIIVPLNNFETTWIEFLAQYFTLYFDPNKFQVPGILLLHYEAVPKYLKQLRKRRWSLITYDEDQRLKNRSTLQSRTAAKLRNSAEHKLVLSGTPIEKHPQDLWAQFRFLAPEVFGTRWVDFENEFLEPVNVEISKYRRGSMRWQRAIKQLVIAKSRRKFDADKMPRFLELIKPYAVRVDIDDVLDLPAATLTPVPVRLGSAQRRAYDEMNRHSVTRIDGHKITAPLAVTRRIKLHQICGGYVLDDEGVICEVGDAKLKATLALVRKHKKPIVIFCRYLEEIAVIDEKLSALGYAVDLIVGGVKNRAAVQRDFQKGLIDVLICQQRTGGVGVDLFRASVAIVYSMTQSYIDFDQAIKRLRRRGQIHPVKIFLPYAVDTVDEVIYEDVIRKSKVAQAILKELK